MYLSLSLGSIVVHKHYDYLALSYSYDYATSTRGFQCFSRFVFFNYEEENHQVLNLYLRYGPVYRVYSVY